MKHRRSVSHLSLELGEKLPPIKYQAKYEIWTQSSPLLLSYSGQYWPLDPWSFGYKMSWHHHFIQLDICLKLFHNCRKSSCITAKNVFSEVTVTLINKMHSVHIWGQVPNLKKCTCTHDASERLCSRGRERAKDNPETYEADMEARWPLTVTSSVKSCSGLTSSPNSCQNPNSHFPVDACCVCVCVRASTQRRLNSESSWGLDWGIR